MQRVPPPCAGRIFHTSRPFPPRSRRSAHAAPQALIVGGEALRLKERLGGGIERPDVEPEQCDIAARRLSAHADPVDVERQRPVRYPPSCPFTRPPALAKSILPV